MAEQLKVYEIAFDKVTQIEPSINEYGEKNIRIPIEECKLIRVKKLEHPKN